MFCFVLLLLVLFVLPWRWYTESSLSTAQEIIRNEFVYTQARHRIVTTADLFADQVHTRRRSCCSWTWPLTNFIIISHRHIVIHLSILTHHSITIHNPECYSRRKLCVLGVCFSELLKLRRPYRIDTLNQGVFSLKTPRLNIDEYVLLHTVHLSRQRPSYRSRMHT